MKTIETNIIALNQVEKKEIKQDIKEKLTSILKSIKIEIEEAFKRIPWEDLQHCEDFVADTLSHYWLRF